MDAARPPMSESETDQRYQLLVQELQRVIVAHTDSIDGKEANTLVMASLASLIALEGCAMCGAAGATPTVGVLMHLFRGMPIQSNCAEAIELYRVAQADGRRR